MEDLGYKRSVSHKPVLDKGPCVVHMVFMFDLFAARFTVVKSQLVF
jgi:hypothetical protein